MKVLVCGSRDVEFPYFRFSEILEQFQIDEIISGGARGPDSMAITWAKEHNIPVSLHIPNWDLYGKYAGLRRNEEMAEIADMCVAFWDGKSRGTLHAMTCINKRGKPLYLYNV
jgi:hypothetical protein